MVVLQLGTTERGLCIVLGVGDLFCILTMYMCSFVLALDAV